MLGNIGQPEGKPTPFFTDSKNADALNLVFHKRSKYVKTKYHWIREHVGLGGRGTARLVHVESTDLAADLFTTVLCDPMFEAQASVMAKSKRSKSYTMIDRDMWRRMKDGGCRRKPSPYSPIFWNGC